MPRIAFFFFLSLGLGCWMSLQAQDVLLKTDGQKIAGWVTEVGSTYVRYVPTTEKEGKEVDLPKKMVSKIMYASGEEDWFNPMEATSQIPEIQSGSSSAEPTTAALDLVMLLNGQRFQARVEEVGESHIIVVQGEEREQIPREALQEILYSDGTIESFHAPILGTAEAPESANSDKKGKETPEPEASSAPQQALSSARSSFESRKDHTLPSPFRPYLTGGLSLNTGWGVGRQQVERELERRIGDTNPDTSASQIRPGLGGFIGAGMRYEVSSAVSVFAGTRLAIKGFVSEQSFRYGAGDSSQVAEWEESWREQQRLLHLDFPIGVEAQVHEWLMVQAGGVFGFTAWGRDSLNQSRKAFDSSGIEIRSFGSQEASRSKIQGVGISPALFLGAAIPISPNLQAHLRLQTHLTSGQAKAFAQTLWQLGVRWEW